MSSTESFSDPASRPEPEGSSQADELARRAKTESLIVESPTPERDALMQDPSTLCLNCGQALPGTYCPACGQKAQRLRQPVHLFLRDAFVEFLGLDGRLWKTLGVLLFKPGRLTKIYIDGRRVAYLRPLRIYLSATLLFFVLLAILDPVGQLETITQAAIAADADSTTVADHLAENDSLGLALPIEWANDDARRDSLQMVLDSLTSWRDAMPGIASATDPDSASQDVEDLTDQISELEDNLDINRWETEEARAVRLAQIRTESAILAGMPPDSVIYPNDIHEVTEMIHPSTNLDLTLGPEWMARSQSARLFTEARTSEERSRAAAQLARDAIGRVPTVMFLLLPVFALILKVLYVRRDWYYSEHLVFGLHTHAYAFVMFSVLAMVIWRASEVNWAMAAASILAASIPVYFILAQKHVYGQGWIRTLLKTWMLGWIYGFTLLMGLFIAIALAALMG